ncbi:hypothetical protein VNO77_37410 [Canavalia gladiata]|uniref:Uncharacterized protein n=1 Tax=Canavalia gladiata TaxID=3824 RepID=A0AAN9KAH6_CANGL
MWWLVAVLECTERCMGSLRLGFLATHDHVLYSTVFYDMKRGDRGLTWIVPTSATDTSRESNARSNGTSFDGELPPPPSFRPRAFNFDPPSLSFASHRPSSS